MIKVSDKENTDLATIQLKNKKTPDEAHVFRTDGTIDENAIDKVKNMFSSHNDKILHIDQQLYKKYELNEEEIVFIESNVKEMN